MSANPVRVATAFILTGISVLSARVASDSPLPRTLFGKAQTSDAIRLETEVPNALVGFEQLKGSPARGEQLWLSDRLECNVCHEVCVEATCASPNLYGLGRRLTRQKIVQAILEPSAEYSPGFKNVVITLGNGRTLTGVEMANLSTDAVLAILGKQERILFLERSTIDKLEVAPSAMPEGQIKAAELSSPEFADLLAYLESL